MKENFCSEVQLAYLFCSTSQWKRNNSCYLFSCTSIFIWYRLCWFFSIFLFVILFAFESSEKKKSSDIILLLSSWSWGKMNRSGFYDVCAHCSRSPFSFFFFICLLCLSFLVSTNILLPLGNWFLISVLEWGGGMGQGWLEGESSHSSQTQSEILMLRTRLTPQTPGCHPLHFLSLVQLGFRS